jgi:hypothetical protein
MEILYWREFSRPGLPYKLLREKSGWVCCAHRGKVFEVGVVLAILVLRRKYLVAVTMYVCAQEQLSWWPNREACKSLALLWRI